MRGFFRFLGLLASAGAFVAIVIDGAKSIGDGVLNLTPAGAVWYSINASSLNTTQAAIERHVAPFLWDPVFLSILTTPFFIVLIVLAALFFTLGRRPRTMIGYPTRG